MSVRLKSAETEDGFVSSDEDDDDHDNDDDHDHDHDHAHARDHDHACDHDHDHASGDDGGGDAAAPDGLTKRTLKELRALCKAAGLPQFPGNKADLIERLRNPRQHKNRPAKRAGRRARGPRRPPGQADQPHPANCKKKCCKKRKHPSAAGPSTAVPPDTAIPAKVQAVPVREALPVDPVDRMPAELPEKKPKKPEDRRAWKKTGLFANFFSDRDGLFSGYNAVVDPATGRQAISLHASVLAEVPVCDTKEGTCRLDCCRVVKGLCEPKAKAYRTKVRQAAAVRYADAGKVGYDSHLAGCIEISSRGADVRPDVLFRRRNQLATGGCSWCRTVDGLSSSERDHKYNKGCPMYQEAQEYLLDVAPVRCIYFLEPLHDKGRRLQVSRSFFQSMHLLSKQRLDGIAKTVRDLQASAPRQRHFGSGGGNKLSIAHILQLSAALATAPREPAHYIRFDSRNKTEFFGRGVTARKLWWDVCILHDPMYVEQSLRHGYRHSYDNIKLKPKDEALDNDIDHKILRKPAISYDAALKFFKRFDVKFNKLRVDTCEVCSKFAFRLGRATLTEEQRKKVKLKWQKHLHEADCSYVVLVVVHAGVFRGRADGGE